MPTSPPARLESIRICGYRAFPDPVEIPLEGKSLVLNGERRCERAAFNSAV